MQSFVYILTMGLLFQTIQGIYWIFHVIYRWNYTEFNWIIQFSGIWNWLTMSNVNNNNHISIYYYAKSIYSISGISFARLLKTSKSSLYIYFIPLCIDIVGVIDGTFTISMSFRVSILKYICTLICLQVNKA